VKPDSYPAPKLVRHISSGALPPSSGGADVSPRVPRRTARRAERPDWL